VTDTFVSADLVRIAVVARLRSFAAVTALVGQRVYNGKPPEDPNGDGSPLAFPYLQLGSSGETPLRRMGRHGTRGTEMIAGFSLHDDNMEGLAMFRAVHAALNLHPLALGDGREVRGEVELVGTTGDPDGGSEVVIRYTPRVP
jgi:hypothetical protein